MKNQVHDQTLLEAYTANLTELRVVVKEWNDAKNGNTYFSSRVYMDKKEVARLPFQYGYEDQGYYESVQLVYTTICDNPPGSMSLTEFAQVMRLTLNLNKSSARKKEVRRWGRPKKGKEPVKALAESNILDSMIESYKTELEMIASGSPQNITRHSHSMFIQGGVEALLEYKRRMGEAS